MPTFRRARAAATGLTDVHGRVIEPVQCGTATSLAPTMQSPSTVRFAAGGPVWAPGFRHLSTAFAPIEFRFKEAPEDFRVTELPLFEPAGEGTHLFFELEKRGLSTRAAIRRIAAATGRRESDVGYAGRKDAQAVTRQTLSVEHVEPDALRALALPRIKIGRIARHPSKLRVGQLAGNRFELLLRGISRAGHERLLEVLALLETTGVPNYYGAQRFGRAGLTHHLGLLLLRHEHAAYVLALASPEHAPDTPASRELAAAIGSGTRSAHRGLARLARHLDPDLAVIARQLARRPGDMASAVRAVLPRTRQLHISALQSLVFNRVLAHRLAEASEAGGGEGAPGIGRVVPGDVALIAESGAVFSVTDTEDPVELEARAARFEISPTGPIPGARMAAATGWTAAVESAALLPEGLQLEDFGRIGPRVNQGGARRPLRARIRDLSAAWEDDVTTLAFTLPKGAFATVVLEELRKERRPE